MLIFNGDSGLLKHVVSKERGLFSLTTLSRKVIYFLFVFTANLQITFGNKIDSLNLTTKLLYE